MNSTIFYRLLWKEFRQVRAFAICLLAFGLALQLILLAMNSTLAGSQAASVIGLLFPALFVAGCAATIFSMEHENRSFLMQRMLPVRPRAVFAAKIAVCVSLALALLLILSTLPQLSGAHYVISGWLSPAAMLLLTIEFLVWGTLFSVNDRRPMRCLALTVAVPLSIAGVIFFVDSFFHGPEETSFLVTPIIAAIRIGIILAVGTLALLKSHRWFDERQSTGKMATLLDRIYPQSRTQTITSAAVGLRSDVSRLFWLQRRSTLWTMLGIVIATLIGIGWTLGVFWYSSQRIPETMVFYSFVVLGISGALIGGVVWLAANSKRGFLTNTGVHPLKVAVSQLLGGALFVLPGIAIAAALSLGFVPRERSYDPSMLVDNSLLLQMILFAFTGFGWAQMVASCNRSKMIAVIIGPLVGILAAAWPLLCLYSNVPFWFGPAIVLVLPLAFALINARNWLLGLAPSRIAMSVVGVGIVASVVLFGFYRATEFQPADEQRVAAILSIDEPIPLEKQMSPQKMAKVRSVIAEIKELHKTPHWNAYEKERRTAEPQRLALLERVIDMQPVEVATIPDPTLGNANTAYYMEFFLETGLINATHDNDLELAERIILCLNGEALHDRTTNISHHVWGWAAHPDNNSESLIRVARHMLNESETVTSMSARKLANLRVAWNCFSADGKSPQEAFESVHSFHKDHKMHPALKLANRVFFWESIRDKRIASRAIILDNKMREHTRRCVNSNTKFKEAKELAMESQEDFSRAAGDYGEPVFDIVNSTRMRDLEFRLWFDYLGVSNARSETLRIAIIAWSKDHESAVPEELSELVPKYLPHVPYDPITGRPFHWFPNGIDIEKATEFVGQLDPNQIGANEIQIDGLKERVEREMKTADRPFLLRSQNISNPGFEHHNLDIETEELNYLHILYGLRMKIEFVQVDR